MPHDISSFVAWVIDQHPESSTIPPDEKAIIQKDFEDKLDRMVNTALLAEMPPEKLEQFNQLLDQDSEEQIQQFVEQAVPHHQDVVMGVLTDFAKMYLGEDYVGTRRTTS